MKKTTRVWIAVIVVGVIVESWAIYVLRPSGGRWRYEAIVKDEPAAHALYDQMIATMREARSLSYVCSCSGPGKRAKSYRIWLQKPNSFCVEAADTRGALTGTLVGDGNDLWIHWPGRCPLIDPEDTNVPRELWSRQYKTHPTPLGRHSIGHEVMDLGIRHMPFIDPSTFHGYTDSLHPHMNGVAGRRTDTIRGEKCDVIEVCFMNAQRTWYLWLSQKDHLPRQAKQVIRGVGTFVGVEDWLDVTVDAEIPQEKFVWSPPAGWQKYVRPDPEEKLLKPGEEAPDFSLRALKGGRITLSDYHGKIVWLYIWRSG